MICFEKLCRMTVTYAELSDKFVGLVVVNRIVKMSAENSAGPEPFF